MRDKFVSELIGLADDPCFVFLSGDLGFGSFEDLRGKLGDRFLNAGVAEQNMVSVSAGLARGGFSPWVYSIGPFLYARALEQIRNDVVFHGLNVTLVGNGGGLGYGVMGPTHLSFDDYGILTAIGELEIFLPSFDEDLSQLVKELHKASSPAYLRLSNVAPTPSGFVAPAFKAWRCVMSGDKGVLVTAGALVSDYLNFYTGVEPEKRPEIWVPGVLPLSKNALPPELKASIRDQQALMVCEEHAWGGGIGMQLLAELARSSIPVDRLVWRGVGKAVHTHYGSRGYLLDQLGISPAATQNLLSNQ